MAIGAPAPRRAEASQRGLVRHGTFQTTPRTPCWKSALRISCASLRLNLSGFKIAAEGPVRKQLADDVLKRPGKTLRVTLARREHRRFRIPSIVGFLPHRPPGSLVQQLEPGREHEGGGPGALKNSRGDELKVEPLDFALEYIP